MLRLLPDELIHSYILRQYLANGQSRLGVKAICSPLSGWKKFNMIKYPEGFLCLTASCKVEIFSQGCPMPNRKYYELAYSHGGWSSFIYRSIFDDSGCFCIERDSQILNGLLDRVIKYCPQCICESIENYGVGYFKKNWAEKNGSGICHIHEVPLIQLPNDDLGTAFDALIINLLSGKEKFVKRTALIPQKICSGSKWVDFLWMSSPCMLGELHQYLIDHSELVVVCADPNSASEEVWAVLKLLRKDKKYDERGFWELISYFEKYFPVDLSNFLRDNSECLMVSSILHDGSCYFNEMIKSKRQSCINCNYKDFWCPAENKT